MFKPNSDRLALKLIESEEKTPAGILLPDSAKEKPVWGRVVAIGNGRITDNGTRIATAYKVGQVVCFGRYAGAEVSCDGEKYLVVSDSDVIGHREEK